MQQDVTMYVQPWLPSQPQSITILWPVPNRLVLYMLMNNFSELSHGRDNWNQWNGILYTVTSTGKTLICITEESMLNGSINRSNNTVSSTIRTPKRINWCCTENLINQALETLANVYTKYQDNQVIAWELIHLQCFEPVSCIPRTSWNSHQLLDE